MRAQRITLCSLLYGANLCLAETQEAANTTASTEAKNATLRPWETGPVRMITTDELERHDGKQTSDRWLAIMSQVYDVTAGDQYYGDNGPYSVFVGVDANVPFITGNFTKEEAARPITDLDKNQLMSLQSWAEFYEKEDKYPFVGLLKGDLYDDSGKPTELLGKLDVLIAEAKVENEEKKRLRKERIAKKRRENEEKKKLLEQKRKEQAQEEL